MDMVYKAREFENLRDVKEMNAPTDKTKWVRFRSLAVPSVRSDFISQRVFTTGMVSS